MINNIVLPSWVMLLIATSVPIALAVLALINLKMMKDQDL